MRGGGEGLASKVVSGVVDWVRGIEVVYYDRDGGGKAGCSGASRKIAAPAAGGFKVLTEDYADKYDLSRAYAGCNGARKGEEAGKAKEKQEASAPNHKATDESYYPVPRELYDRGDSRQASIFSPTASAYVDARQPVADEGEKFRPAGQINVTQPMDKR